MNKACLIMLAFFTCTATARQTDDFPELLTRQSYQLRGDVVKLVETEVFYRTDAGMSSIRSMRFDEQGRTDTLELTDTNKIHTLKVFRYEDGHINSIVTFTGGKMDDSSSLDYDKSGLLREIRTFSAKGRMTQWVRYRYNSKKQPLYIMYNDGSNKLQQMIRFRQTGKEEYLRTVFNDDLKYVSGTQLMHTSDSTQRQETFYYYGAPDSCTGIESITYDNAGRETGRVVMDGEKRMISYSSCSYNEAGDPEKELVFPAASEDKKEITHEYKYDPQGNWLQRTTYLNGALEKVTVREISYREAGGEPR